MASIKEWNFQSNEGTARYVRYWPNEPASWIALLAHGYGEHIARYDHVADALRAAGACVVGPDHQGHGRSAGETALIKDFEIIIDDLQELARRTREQNPGLPMVLIGHSMGGMIAARYAQRYGKELKALVLSGPMFGTRELLTQLMAMDPIPDIPLEPSLLSRDPSVGKAYAEDPLVWHGAFKRTTLEAIIAAMDTIAQGPSLGDLPTLWMHGESDLIVPLDATVPMMEHLRGKTFEKKTYPGAMHEIFNETNREEVIADMVAFLRRFVA
jgi:alpha-beta hydrolase superfamily lysophospholipase